MTVRELGSGGAVRWHSELGAPAVHMRESSREGEGALEQVK